MYEPPEIMGMTCIREAWQALQGGYDVNDWKLPLPFWAHRDFEQNGEQAWDILRQDLWVNPTPKPMCIYLHVPFCSSKCAFCDSYSFGLSRNRSVEKKEYVDLLCAEINLWGNMGNLSSRPVSSVHFGGGTPTFLGEELFSRLVYSCMDHFNTDHLTEWAIESNTSTLTPSMFSTLHEIGIRRLHMGVQSMEDGVRKTIGRRQPSSRVLDSIHQALDLGWVVSVDLICGLPGQTIPGFIQGIQDLINVGVNGFSLYELLIYPQNRKWAAQHQLVDRDHLPNYFLFQVGAKLLEEQGFAKNLFNHWADEKDRNIYFTFPQRGEDLLAIGCIADGVFGDYHYRHPGYKDYLLTAGNQKPGLQGGLRRNSLETRLNPLILAIQSGHIAAPMADEFKALTTTQGVPLVDLWHKHALVEEKSHGSLRLTTNGSWFAGNMINEIICAITLPDQRK
ncbi:MAG: radical SAM protein [Anaerolineaceae bacterium]|nr:radical SAM protein [Anaerolineaceae bacterium]